MSAPTLPTTSEISANIVAQMQASLNQTIPLLPKSFTRVLAKAIAAIFTLLYKYGGFIFLQMFVAYASNDDTEINGQTVAPLTLWGRLIGIGDISAATQAEMTIDITVTSQTGSLPAYTQLTNSDNGIIYLTTASVLLDDDTVTATIRASSDQSGGDGSGETGNLDAGDSVSFVNPLSYVDSEASVTEQTVTGSDGETVAAYRQRIVDRFQKLPQGGASADYEEWGEEPSGILNVYPYTGDPGEVNVYVEATDEEDGIPTDAQLLEVYESIQYDDEGLASRRPIGALVNVYAITRVEFDIEVTDLEDVDDLTDVQDSIETAVSEYFEERAPYIDGLSVLPRYDSVTRSGAAGVVNDVVDSEGGIFGGVIMTMNGETVERYSLDEGEKAKLGTITFS